MINIPGKCYLNIDITGVKNLVDIATQLSLTIKESAGNVLPVATLTISSSPSLLDYISNEGVDVLITLGFSMDDAKQSKWKIYNFDISKSTLTAFMSINRSYLNDSEVKVYEGTSVEVIKKVASEYFSVIDDKGKSTIEASGYSDRMKWIRHRLVARDFVNNVWLHSYSPGKLIVPAILAQTPVNSNIDGIFRLKDICNKSTITDVRDDVSTSLRLYTKDAFISNSGTMNNIVGKFKYSEFDSDSADVEISEVSLDPIFGEIINRSSYSDLVLRKGYKSDNVHSNFFKAVPYNLNKLALFGGFAKKFSVIDLGYLKVLDTINLVIPVYEQIAASEVQSGYYIVTDTFTKVEVKDSTAVIIKDVIARKDSVTAVAYQGVFV